MAESSGELLGGRYRLLGERTTFPFGAWWEAEDDQGARTVVLRFNAEVADPAAKAQAAVSATATLDTAHVVPWADGGVDAKGHGWLAAPMFGPWSLTEHVTRGEGIPPGEAATLMHQLARGVATAEAAGVQHNTLTSEFVRLVPLPEGGYGVKVYGFGLAELLPSYKPLRKQDAYLGVPDYMSPELCSGKAAEGSSADVYAIGIIMYEAVRGRPPFAPTFASASASTTLKRHIFEKPLPLHVRYANAPFIKTYENICFKALAKTANRRQVTVAELEKELESLIVDEMRSQIVSLDAVSGRGPTTSRRLRTQVIAQIPMDEPPKAEVRVTPKAEAPKAEAPRVEQASPQSAQGSAPGAYAQGASNQGSAAPAYSQGSASAAQGAQPAPTVAAPTPEPERYEEDPPEPGPLMETPLTPRRGDSTLVFAGLGPAVRELAEAARKADEDEEEGSAEEEALPAGSGLSSQPRKGKKKKGRKNTGMSAIAPTEREVPRPEPKPQPVATGPSSATVVTSKAPSEALASAKVEPGRKKEDSASAVPVAKPKPAAKGKDEEEWFGDDDTTKQKGSSKAWIFLLLAAVVVIVVVIVLMSGGDKNEPTPQPVGMAPGATPNGQRYQFESEPVVPASAVVKTEPAAPIAPAPEPPKVATATVEPVAKPEVAKVEPEVAKVEPKPEVAKVEPKPEVARVEPAKVEPKPEPAKVEPKPEPAKVEPKPVVAKVEPPPAKLEPAKVEPSKVTPEPAKVDKAPEPAKVEPTKTDPPGSPEDQFRQKAQHYIQLGMQAYKGENFKLAIGYFKKAQEADPNNIQAARYLKQAQEKAAQ